MSLDADQAIDRRRLKRRLTVWRIAAIVAVVVAVVAAVGRFGVGANHVARLVVGGIIIDDPWRDDALAGIAEDDNAKALIVRIDSPGGTMVGGEALYTGLRAVAGRKPVVAVMGGTATSAAYMTALGADRILARAGSVTGSIGVIVQTADITGLLEKLGVKPEAIKSRPLKAQPSPLEPLTPKGREAARVVVLDLFELFVDMVEERRSLPRDTVLALADGRVFTGRQALANGLIDALGGEADARRWLAETHAIATSLPVKDVEIEHEGALWRDLIGGLAGKVLFSERLRLDGPISLWHPSLW
ncbi:MAG: signal peptide peptidase SppA [Rhodospirillales bacterium]